MPTKLNIKRKNTRGRQVDATIDRITDAAFRLLIEKGALRVSISEISTKAKISRTTIYRHFPTIEDVEAAVFRKLREGFETGLLAAIAADPTPENRIDVISLYMGSFMESGNIWRPIEVDPRFTIDLIHRFFGDRITTYREALSPVFDLAEILHGHKVDRQAAAELLNHCYISLNFRSLREKPRDTHILIAQLLRAVVQIPQ